MSLWWWFLRQKTKNPETIVKHYLFVTLLAVLQDCLIGPFLLVCLIKQNMSVYKHEQLKTSVFHPLHIMWPSHQSHIFFRIHNVLDAVINQREKTLQNGAPLAPSSHEMEARSNQQRQKKTPSHPLCEFSQSRCSFLLFKQACICSEQQKGRDE